MKNQYDKYYETENLFGEPYPELIDFFSSHPKRGKLLDLGCGQGRDSIALARLGYEVIGIDNSAVGIQQMNEMARIENLPLQGVVADIYQYDHFGECDFILLDSMFHFGKKELHKESGLLKKIIARVKPNCLIIICIQNTGNKLKILNNTIDFNGRMERIVEKSFPYKFQDSQTNHTSITKYKMIVVRK